MKKKLIASLMVIVLLFGLSFNIVVNAESSDLLISVGTGNYHIEVTTTTTIDDIKKVLGEPKLTTPSAFGGEAYAFYTDDNYSNYLYIETLEDGQIFSYGSIDKTFKTNTYSYGDDYPYSGRMPLCGYFAVDGGINAGIFYNRYALFNGNYFKIMDFYEENFLSDVDKYSISLSKQGILMYNALSKQRGNRDTTPLVFDEETFYINEQFKEFGTSIDEYIKEMDLMVAHRKALGAKFSIEISDAYYMINPCMFADLANDNQYTVFEGKNIGLFDYNLETKELSAYAISEDVFERIGKVDYTEEEKEKLDKGREEYKLAIETLENDDPVYEIEPVIDTPEGLVAGKLTKSKQEGILQYVNAIRVAGGLPKFQTNDRINEVAQHKSTLLSYRAVKLGLDIAHGFEKPTGVLDSFYDTAFGIKDGMVDVGGYAENIATSNGDVKYSTMKMVIHNLIADESNELWATFGHRLALLSSEHKYMGFGISPYVAVNEFNGYQGDYYNECIEAWPSKGVTFLETTTQKFAWTARFIDRYTVQKDKTTATVKCLNTGEKWEFTEYEMSTNKKYVLTGNDTISAWSNKVIMYDSSIIPQAGYVYEVTIHGLKDDTTGQDVDYTYRAVFEYADTSNYADTINSIEIEEPELDKDGEIYQATLGQEIKLNVKIDNTEVIDKKVTWTSSNEDVIEVKQNGKLVIKKVTDTPVIIRVSSDANGLSDSIEIVVKEAPKYLKGDINQDGIVNVNDVNYGMRGIVGKVTLTDLEEQIGDVNEDGIFNVNDINMIMRFIVGKINNF